MTIQQPLSGYPSGSTKDCYCCGKPNVMYEALVCAECWEAFGPSLQTMIYKATMDEAIPAVVAGTVRLAACDWLKAKLKPAPKVLDLSKLELDF